MTQAVSAQSNGIAITPPTSEDIFKVIELDEAVSGERKEDFWHKTFSELSTRTNNVFYVARIGDDVAGYTIGKIRAWEFGSPPTGWINAIAVHPQYRKLGIGAALMDAIKAYFQSEGITTMRTMLHIDDHALMSFFRFHGLSAGPFIELETSLDPTSRD